MEGIAQAEAEHRSIDDLTAKLIAVSLHLPGDGGLPALAETGAIDKEKVVEDLADRYGTAAEQANRLLVWCLALRRYAEVYGDREPLERWDELTAPGAYVEPMAKFLGECGLEDIDEAMIEFHDRYIGHFANEAEMAEYFTREYGVREAIGALAVDNFVKHYIRFDGEAFVRDLQRNADITVIAGDDGDFYVFYPAF